MTKQEEIRAELAERQDYDCVGCTLPDTISCVHPCKQEYLVADNLLSYLDSVGCVLKVEKELPSNCIDCKEHHCHYDDGGQDCSCALSVFANPQTHGIPESCPIRVMGYTAIERLI